MPDCAKCKKAFELEMPVRLSRDVKLVCEPCRPDRVAMIMLMLPKEGDFDFGRMTGWEQQFIPSARSYFASKGTLTEAMYVRCEQIWAERA